MKVDKIHPSERIKSKYKKETKVGKYCRTKNKIEEINIEKINQNEKIFHRSFKKHSYDYEKEERQCYSRSNFSGKSCWSHEEHRNNEDRRKLSARQMRAIEKLEIAIEP